MKNTKIIALLVALMLVLSTLVACGGGTGDGGNGDGGTPTVESLTEAANNALKSGAYGVTMTLAIDEEKSTEGIFDDEDVANMMSTMLKDGITMEAAIDGDNLVIKMLIELEAEGQKVSMGTDIAVIGKTFYLGNTQTMGDQSQSMKMKFNLTDAQLSEVKGDYDVKVDLTPADFETVEFTSKDGKHTVAASGIKEESLEKFNSIIFSIMGTGDASAMTEAITDLTYTAVFADGKYESTEIGFAVTEEDMTIAFKQTMAFKYTGVTVAAPADADTYVEADYDDIFGGNIVTPPEEAYTTHDEYLAAEVGDEVFVKTYVQNKQGWWEKDGVGVATFYTEDQQGGYYIYEMPISKADYDLLVPGTCIEVRGYIGEYAGMHEIVDAEYVILADETPYVAEALDLTGSLKNSDLANYQSQFMTLKGAKVLDKGNGKAFYYGWDGSGSQGGDIYFDVEIDGAKYTLVIESYLTGADSDVYKAAEALKIGDVIDVTGYVYWYDGVQPHIITIEATK